MKKGLIVGGLAIAIVLFLAPATEAAFTDEVIGILLGEPISVINNIYVLTGVAPFWEVSNGFLQPNVTETGTNQLLAEMFNATDNVTTPEVCLDGDCRSEWPTIAGSETDPHWTANYTACSSSQKLYFDGSGNLACNNDDDDPESINCGIITGNTSNLCTITPGGEESDPLWLANYTACSSSQKLYFNGNSLACNNDDAGTDDQTCAEVSGCVEGALTSESDPYWTANQSNYYTSSEVDSALAGQDECSEISGCVVGALTSESDPLWLANYTACGSGYHLYFSGDSLACEADDDDPESINCGIITGNTSNLCSITDTTDDNVDSSELDNLCNTNDKILKRVSGTWQCADDATGGGGGTSIWETSGNWMYPNLTAGGKNNINVTAINASDWNNFTETIDTEGEFESVLFAVTVPSEDVATNTSMKNYVDGTFLTEAINDSYYLVTNPFGFYNLSNFNIADYSTTSQMNTAIGNANTSMKDYVDGTFLTGYTESDPLWLANYTACSSSQKLYFNGNSLACNNDDAGTDDQTCAEVSGCVEGALTSESDPYWTANYTACSSSQKLYFNGDDLACNNDDDSPDDDSEVPNDITLATSNNITVNDASEGIILNGGGHTWFLYINASGNPKMVEI